jgi:hypothetical protein
MEVENLYSDELRTKIMKLISRVNNYYITLLHSIIILGLFCTRLYQVLRLLMSLTREKNAEPTV